MGFDTSDDAAVYRLTATLAVVETVDFFPPVVDDPYAFGQIAAANAMSDIWAMGAKALFALNLVAFPKELPLVDARRDPRRRRRQGDRGGHSGAGRPLDAVARAEVRHGGDRAWCTPSGC